MEFTQFISKTHVYLQQELNSIGATNPNDPRRIQVYRLVFSKFIDKFKVYQPLLTDIKNEYEKYIRALEQKLAVLDKKSTLLAISEFEHSRNIDSICKEYDLRIQVILLEKDSLLKQIATLKSSLNDLKDQLQATCAEFEMFKSSDSPDSKRLFDLQLELEQIGLIHANELASRDSKISLLESNIADCKAQMAQQFEAIDSSKKLHSSSLAAIYNNHASQIAKMQSEHESQIESIRSALVLDAKPRARQNEGQNVTKPKLSLNQELDWKLICAHFKYPIDSMIANLKGLDSETVIIRLLEQLIVANSDFFDAPGCEDNIPKYLQSNDPVPKRKLEPASCLAMINDLYKQKREYQIRKAPVHVCLVKLD